MCHWLNGMDALDCYIKMQYVLKKTAVSVWSKAVLSKPIDPAGHRGYNHEAPQRM